MERSLKWSDMNNKIQICDQLGFCGGVRNAVWKSVLSVEKNKKVVVFGDLIHNDRVLHELKLNNIEIIKDFDYITQETRVIIPAHGITKENLGILQSKTSDIIDMTCPMVVNMRKELIHLSNHCKYVILLGRKNHTEIVGAVSFTKQNNVILIESLNELKNVMENDKNMQCMNDQIGLISQTTASSSEFYKIRDWLIERQNKDICVCDTLCPTVITRQKKAACYAEESSAIIVVGDKRSSNTYSLYEKSKEINPTSYLLTSNQPIHLKEEEKKSLQQAKNITILAGTSSPYYILEETVEALKNTLENHSLEQIPAIVIFGPTGVGKTDFSEEIAEHLNGEIINYDSMQVYKHLCIGTARPKQCEQKVPHHLFGYIDPANRTTVASYQKDAIKKLKEIVQKKKIPILVGGSYLYVSSLIDGLFTMPTTENKTDVRDKILHQTEKNGLHYMYNQLLSVDEKAARKIHSNDKKRILRALEVYYLTGKPISELQSENTEKAPFFFVKLGLLRKPEIVYNRIQMRIESMLKEGLLDEIKWLLDQGYEQALYEIKAHGYREMVEYVKNKCTLQEAMYNMELNTKHYAKRQLTWLRQRSDFHLLNIDTEESTYSTKTAIEMIQLSLKHALIQYTFDKPNVRS